MFEPRFDHLRRRRRALRFVPPVGDPPLANRGESHRLRDLILRIIHFVRVLLRIVRPDDAAVPRLVVVPVHVEPFAHAGVAARVGSSRGGERASGALGSRRRFGVRRVHTLGHLRGSEPGGQQHPPPTGPLPRVLLRGGGGSRGLALGRGFLIEPPPLLLLGGFLRDPTGAFAVHAFVRFLGEATLLGVLRSLLLRAFGAILALQRGDVWRQVRLGEVLPQQVVLAVALAPLERIRKGHRLLEAHANGPPRGLGERVSLGLLPPVHAQVVAAREVLPVVRIHPDRVPVSLGVVPLLLRVGERRVVHRHRPDLRAALALRVVLQPFLAQRVHDVEAFARVQVEERAAAVERVTADVVGRVRVIRFEVIRLLRERLDLARQSSLPLVDREPVLVHLTAGTDGRVDQAQEDLCSGGKERGNEGSGSGRVRFGCRLLGNGFAKEP